MQVFVQKTCGLDLLIPSISRNCLTVSRWSSQIITLTVFTIISEIVVLRRPSCGSSSKLSLPFKNTECHWKHLVCDTHSSLKAFQSVVKCDFLKRAHNWIAYQCLMFISIVRQLLNTLYIYEHGSSLLTPIKVKFLLKVDKASGYTCICMVTTFHFFNFLTCDCLITFWTTLVECHFKSEVTLLRSLRNMRPLNMKLNAGFTLATSSLWISE